MSDAIVFEDFSAEMAGREVLRRVSFSVSAGEIAAVFGRTGSGKTCVASALCGRLRGVQGSARMLGREVSVTFRAHLNRPVSVGFQSPSFAPELTVHENLELQASVWRSSRQRRVNRIAFLRQLLDLEALCHVRAGKLSQGEKAALEIARALLPEAQIVVIDSLFDHVDPHLRNKVFRSIFDTARKEGTAFLVTTNDPEVAELCDKIVLLDSGRVLAADSPENIRAGAPDEMILIQSTGNPVLRRQISERFQVVVREEGGGLVFSVPDGDLAASEILSELESQVACVRVRRQSLYEIIDSLAASQNEGRRV